MFIHFLLGKGATGVSGGGFTIESDFGFGASYDAFDDGPAPIGCTININILPDGTWTITVGGDDDIVDTPLSGNWGLPTTTGVGVDYEVRFTVNNQVNSPTITNPAPTYKAISVTRTLELSKLTGSSQTASGDVTVEIRKIGTASPVGTDTTNLAATTGT